MSCLLNKFKWFFNESKKNQEDKKMLKSPQNRFGCESQHSRGAGNSLLLDIIFSESPIGTAL